MVLMFAIPMTAGALALPDSYLIILRDVFKEAVPVLVVLAIDALIIVTSGLFGSVLLGVERIDEKAKISFKELAKSRLFIAFSLSHLHPAITLPITFFVLTTYAQNQPLQAALYVSITNSTARFAMFLILYTIARKMIRKVARAKPTQAEHAMSVDVKAIGKLGDSSFVLTAESTTLT
jgi:hypothetical protein